MKLNFSYKKICSAQDQEMIDVVNNSMSLREIMSIWKEISFSPNKTRLYRLHSKIGNKIVDIVSGKDPRFSRNIVDVYQFVNSFRKPFLKSLNINSSQKSIKQIDNQQILGNSKCEGIIKNQIKFV